LHEKPIIPLPPLGRHPWQGRDTRKGLEDGRDLDEMGRSWQVELEGFLALRRQYLLY